MTTFIDAYALDPNSERLARYRAEKLGLVGELVPELQRKAALVAAKAGDVVITTPGHFDFWRMVDNRVSLQVLGGKEDEPRNRFFEWIEWALVREGCTRAEARRVAINPPKTDKSQFWDRYYHASKLAYGMRDLHKQRAYIIPLTTPVKKVRTMNLHSERRQLTTLTPTH